MKKFIYIIVLFVACFMVVSCNNNDQPTNPSETVIKPTVDPSINPTNPDNLLNLIVFASQTVKYDGKSHSLVATNLPDGVTVTYQGNEQTEVGEYEVTANFFYNGEAIGSKTATLKIDSSQTVDDLPWV